MKKLNRFVIGLLAACVLAGLPAKPASATAITFDLNTEFSGGTAPAGASPWVTATFADIVGGVRLTIDAVNLTGTEFISEFYFNFDPSKNAAANLGSAPGTGTQTAYNTLSGGNDAFKADGDGFFDFVIDFPPPPGTVAEKFTAGETFVLEFLGLGLTAADFSFPSVNGPVGKTGFYAAAHVQGIGIDGDLSGWIGAGTVPGGGTAPVPSTLALLGLGLAALTWVRRR